MSPKDSSDTKRNSRSANSPLKRERELRGWTQSGLAERIGTTQVNISRWEKGVTTPGPYYRQRLGELFGKSIQELGFIPESDDEQNEKTPIFPTSPASSLALPIWHVPYRRNPFFTGREGILTYLYNELRGNQTTHLTRTLAISGLGGIGKTQIAIEYAYRYRGLYQAIFWINVSTRDALIADLVLLAALLGLPEQHEENQDAVVRVVKRWLDSHTNWLLILDNVDSLEMIVDFLPVHDTGDVLLTTRMQALATIAQGIEVDKMGLEEGMLFLLRRTKAIAPGTTLDQVPQESLIQAREIVGALDGLPLALDQAGAYIEETRSGLSQYLDLYGMRRKELLLRRGRFSIDHPHSVATTWSLSFQQVEQASRAAADLLCLLAFLNPEAIPEELITLGAAELGTELGEVVPDPLKVDKIIELLLSYSLIRRIPEEKSLSIHHLVQTVLKDSMDKDTQRLWAERAIRAVNCAFPYVEPQVNLQTWGMCQRYVPHVLICATYINEYTLVFPAAARLLNEAAFYLIRRGRYAQAELLLLMALSIRRQVLEVDHTDTARTLNGLGVVYFSQGRYQDAEPLLRESLEILRKKLGMEHTDVAQILYDLASLYRVQGLYMKAEPLYLQALQIRGAISKIDPPILAESCYGLTKLYYSQEQYQKAEMYCMQALRIQEQSLGNSHPRVASTLNMLAKIYQRQNKLDQAEEMHMRALYIRESTSGLDHPHVATIVNSLIEIYHAQGKYRKAQPLIVRSLRIHEQTLGPEHPYIAYSLSNQAENFFLQEEYVQAEFYYKKALAIREQNLGFNHPHTASVYYDLARLYITLERFEEAEAFYSKVLSIREHAFGPDHPAIISILEQYATLLRKQKRMSEADELEARIQAIKAKLVASENS